MTFIVKCQIDDFSTDLLRPIRIPKTFQREKSSQVKYSLSTTLVGNKVGSKNIEEVMRILSSEDTILLFDNKVCPN